jgi:hypothetical protein
MDFRYLTRGLADQLYAAFGSGGAAAGAVGGPALVARNSAQFDKTVNTTLADVPGLSVALTSGTYLFRAVIFTLLDNSIISGSGKIAFGGTCTASSFIAEPTIVEGITVAVPGRLSALGDAVVETQGVDIATFFVSGTITVNAGGTFTVEFAQSTPNGTSSVLVGSTLEVTRIQ